MIDCPKIYKVADNVKKFMIKKGGKKFNKRENPEAYLPGRCTITKTM